MFLNRKHAGTACKNSLTATQLVPMFFSGSRPPNAVRLGVGALGERGHTWLWSLGRTGSRPPNTVIHGFGALGERGL